MRCDVIRAAVGALALVVVLAEPAAADPAKPGDYRSTVTAVDPPSDAFTIRVVGGDAFLQLRVETGHEVLVADYDTTTPYLRIAADGTVSQNLRSQSAHLNDSRYGAVSMDAGMDMGMPMDGEASEAPEWQALDDDGEYTWHDHRIHWMSTARPPHASAGDVIDENWVVDLTVDGSPVRVQGRLVWEEPTPTLAWFGLAAAVAAALALAGARRRTATVVGAALLVASVAAVGVGYAEQSSIPASAGRSPLAVVVPALAVGAAAVALARRGRRAGGIASLAAVALLAGWALLRIAVLLRPVLPTDLQPNVDRAGTAVAIGVAVATAVTVVRDGTLRPVRRHPI